jgi:hypothetical protein
MKRMFIAGAALAVLAPLGVLAPASAAPQAAGSHVALAATTDVGPFDMEQTAHGTGLPDIRDKGSNHILQLGGENEDWSEVGCQVIDGRSWCHLRDTTGNCMNVASDRYVWSNSCVYPDTSESFWKESYLFVNQHWGYSYYLNAIAGTDGVTWFAYMHTNGLIWSTPGS